MIGREEELRKLQKALDCESCAVMVYGKRKVGKTTLIKHAASERKEKTVYYECVRGSLSDNLRNLCQELARVGVIPSIADFGDVREVFRWLSRSAEPLLIIIDEYPYLKAAEKADYVDSLFQSVIDQYLGRNRLILSGSHIGMMKDLLNEGNALYGRFQCVIHLRELDYLTASRFYPDRTIHEKIGFYAIFGGSPYVLTFLDQGKSLEENIQRLVLEENHPVALYLDRLLISDMGVSLQMERILAALKNGKKHYAEIERQTDPGRSGNLSKYLRALLELEIVAANEPINSIGDAKKTTYGINDHLLRFYYTYVRDRKSAVMMLGAKTFYREYIEKTLQDFISRRFEEMCRSYFAMQARMEKLPGIQGIGTYYYDDPKKKRNGEFDVALQLENGYQIWEAKYTKKPLTLDEIHREAGQVREIPLRSVVRLGFVSASGFQEREEGYLYLTGEDLYLASAQSD